MHWLLGNWRRVYCHDLAGWLEKKGGFKYLGVFILEAVTQEKNWDGLIEKLVNFFKESPKLSFRGRVIIINNWIASALWHKLSCVDPRAGLFSKLQSILLGSPKCTLSTKRKRWSRISALFKQIWNFLLEVYPEILNRTCGLGMEEGDLDHPVESQQNGQHCVSYGL